MCSLFSQLALASLAPGEAPREACHVILVAPLNQLLPGWTPIATLTSTGRCTYRWQQVQPRHGWQQSYMNEPRHHRCPWLGSNLPKGASRGSAAHIGRQTACTEYLRTPLPVTSSACPTRASANSAANHVWAANCRGHSLTLLPMAGQHSAQIEQKAPQLVKEARVGVSPAARLLNLPTKGLS